MKVKIFAESSISKLEEKISYFLRDNKEIEIISTNQSNNERLAIFTIIYK